METSISSLRELEIGPGFSSYERKHTRTHKRPALPSIYEEGGKIKYLKKGAQWFFFLQKGGGYMVVV